MKPIDKPWSQLEKSKQSILAMENAKSLEEFEEAWIDYLHNLERAWNKLTSHLKRSPKYQGWNERGKAIQKRRKDPLLSYLVNARGAEEHSVEDITKKETGSIGINPAHGNSLHIKKLEIYNDRINVDADGPIRIDFIPGKMVLIDVENRSRTYSVPNSHLGQKLESMNPVSIAKLGVQYYDSYFKLAEEYFVSK